MPLMILRVSRILGLLLLAAATVPGVPEPVAAAPDMSPTPAQESLPPKCCFTNPSYAGTCVVQPAQGETCVSILEYLNHPTSQGKGYCANTTIRGGWKSADC
jgi:hypothetical protein